MRRFNKMCSSNIMKAQIGDVFNGYGQMGKDVVLQYKEVYSQNKIFASFQQINKNGKLSKIGITYNDGEISEPHLGYKFN